MAVRMVFQEPLSVRTVAMSQARQYYFHGLHAYDLVATIHRIHTLDNDGDIRESTADHCLRLLSHLRWDPENVNDNTNWPSLNQRGITHRTPEWFALYGVQAAIPEGHEFDMEDEDYDDEAPDNEDYHLLQLGNRFNPIVLDDARSTTTTQSLTVSPVSLLQVQDVLDLDDEEIDDWIRNNPDYGQFADAEE